MAPNKFENHIKRQLEEREIQPSESAWDRLSEKLDAERPQPKKRDYFWYGIAASFIGLLVVSVVYFNSTVQVNVPKVQVVDANDGTTKIEANTETEEKDFEDAVVENDKIEQSPALEVKKQSAGPKNQTISSQEIDNITEVAIEKTVTPNSFKEEIINTKILEIVAAVDSLERNSEALTEAEVNDLLRNAQEEILRDKLFNQNGSVDAMALLSEVENELDKSFRDQIFESLKSGFLKVRTAVADRNK